IRSTWGARLRQVFSEIPDPTWRDAPAAALAPRLETTACAPVRAPMPAGLDADEAAGSVPIPLVGQDSRPGEAKPSRCPSMSVYNPFDFFLEPTAETFPFRYDAELEHDLRPYLAHGEAGPRLRQFLADVDLRPRRTIDFLVELNRQLQHAIRYLIRMEPGVQT